jgi:hypothetical protein
MEAGCSSETSVNLQRNTRCYYNDYATNLIISYIIINIIIIIILSMYDRLCGLVIKVPAYKSRDPDSILGATRFSEK